MGAPTALGLSAPVRVLMLLSALVPAGCFGRAAAGRPDGEMPQWRQEDPTHDEHHPEQHHEQDTAYFQAYSQLGHQVMMLRDQRRMDAYRAAILGQPDAFRGKVVLDAGCGTGVLSLWAAQAGARHVHAVEASDAYRFAERLAAHHNVSSVVTVHHSTLEALPPLPEPVDIVLSEWMGKLLLKENMLASVLDARDRFLLRPTAADGSATASTAAAATNAPPLSVADGTANGGGGLMFPSTADLTFALVGSGVEWMHERLAGELRRRAAEFQYFCGDLGHVYPELDYCGALGETQREADRRQLFAQYLRQDLGRRDVVAGSAVLAAHLDLATMSAASAAAADFTADLRLRAGGGGEGGVPVGGGDSATLNTTRVCGVAGWFEVGFPGGAVLSTAPGPLSRSTHWGQTVFLFPGGCVDVAPAGTTKRGPAASGGGGGDNEAAVCDDLRVQVRVRMAGEPRPRDLNVTLAVTTTVGCGAMHRRQSPPPPPQRPPRGSEGGGERVSVSAYSPGRVGARDKDMVNAPPLAAAAGERGLDDWAVRSMRERRRRAAAKLSQARDVARFSGLYEAAWDMTLGQQLGENKEDADDAPTPPLPLPPGGTERWRRRQQQQREEDEEQTKECAAELAPRSSHIPAGARSDSGRGGGDDNGCRTVTSVEYHFKMGDVEHALVPDSYAAGVDADGDGFLDAAELAAALDVDVDVADVETATSSGGAGNGSGGSGSATTSDGYPHVIETAADVARLERLMDTSGDGRVSHAEFDTFVGSGGGLLG